MPADGVRGGLAREPLFAPCIQRMVPDARSPFYRRPEELQAFRVADPRQDRTEHLDPDILAGQKVEGVVVALRESAELDGPALLEGLECPFPPAKRLVHLR